MYAVCKNGRCAQTYSLDNVIKGRTEEVFMKDIKITKGYRCEKCGGVVVDMNGKATLSSHSAVIPYMTIEEVKKNKKSKEKELKRKIKKAKKELRRLKEEY